MSAETLREAERRGAETLAAAGREEAPPTARGLIWPVGYIKIKGNLGAGGDLV